MRLKHAREHNDRHLDFIRGLPCAVCGNPLATEAAHLRAGNLKYGKLPAGMQEKSSDKWALPLCSGHHREQHKVNEQQFWKACGINPWVLAMTLHNCSGDYTMATTVLGLWRSEP
jgi:hypothetical protein